MSIQTRIASAVFYSGPEAAELPALLQQLPGDKGDAFREAIPLSVDLRKAVNAKDEDNAAEIKELLARLFQHSNSPHYRDALCHLGVVDLLRQVVVSDVGRYGLERTHAKKEDEDEQKAAEEARKMKEHGEMRKMVAKILIDLTYGSVDIKRKLCLEGRFVATAVQIINAPKGNVENLTLYYASLLRNLSWQVDAQTQSVLSSTIACLCYASIRSYAEKDARCLSATLNAVFNLSSHSNENRKEIIENVEFMQLCAVLINPKLQVAKTALGILENLGKFLRTNYAQYWVLLRDLQMIPRVLSLLEVTHFEENQKRALRILNFLADADSNVAQSIKQSPALKRLCQSPVEDLADLARRIFSKTSFGGAQRSNMMSHCFGTPKMPSKPVYVLPHEQVDPNTSILVHRNPGESCDITTIENTSFDSSVHTDLNSIPLSPESCSNLPHSPVSGGGEWARQLHSSGYHSGSGAASTVRNSPALSKTSSDWTRVTSQISR
uniref:Adaptin_N domain-containing protein n=1 Tax=Steinernema glaseri TaxID=37863 RepID=A0A1I8AS86_9BILA